MGGAVAAGKAAGMSAGAKFGIAAAAIGVVVGGAMILESNGVNVVPGVNLAIGGSGASNADLPMLNDLSFEEPPLGIVGFADNHSITEVDPLGPYVLAGDNYMESYWPYRIEGTRAVQLTLPDGIWNSQPVAVYDSKFYFVDALHTGEAQVWDAKKESLEDFNSPLPGYEYLVDIAPVDRNSFILVTGPSAYNVPDVDPDEYRIGFMKDNKLVWELGNPDLGIGPWGPTVTVKGKWATIYSDDSPIYTVVNIDTGAHYSNELSPPVGFFDEGILVFNYSEETLTALDEELTPISEVSAPGFDDWRFSRDLGQFISFDEALAGLENFRTGNVPPRVDDYTLYTIGKDGDIFTTYRWGAFSTVVGNTGYRCGDGTLLTKDRTRIFCTGPDSFAAFDVTDTNPAANPQATLGDDLEGIELSTDRDTRLTQIYGAVPDWSLQVPTYAGTPAFHPFDGNRWLIVSSMRSYLVQ